MTINSHIAAETKGLVNPLDFSAHATNKAKVAFLKNTVAQEATQEHRLYLDEMSPACRNSLYVILEALEADIVNV